MRVSICRREEAVAFVTERLRARRKTHIAFANTNLLNSARRLGLAAALSERFTILNDGIGLELMSRIASNQGFPDNLNGTDFTAALLAAVPQGTAVFLFGATPAVVGRAAQTLEARYGIRVCGFSHGFVGADIAGTLVDAINRSGAEIVLVALGNPRQEQWILQYGAALDAPVVMAVGAFLDFSAGAIPRAPVAWQKLRLEWAYRLAREPGRLWKRYSVDVVALVVAVARARLRDGPVADRPAPQTGEP